MLSSGFVFSGQLAGIRCHEDYASAAKKLEQRNVISVFVVLLAQRDGVDLEGAQHRSKTVRDCVIEKVLHAASDSSNFTADVTSSRGTSNHSATTANSSPALTAS